MTDHQTFTNPHQYGERPVKCSRCSVLRRSSEVSELNDKGTVGTYTCIDTARCSKWQKELGLDKVKNEAEAPKPENAK